MVCVISSSAMSVLILILDTDKRRARAPDSLGGDVPDKYYIVTNSELVRLKYLLIFSDKSSSTTR